MALKQVEMAYGKGAVMQLGSQEAAKVRPSRLCRTEWRSLFRLDIYSTGACVCACIRFWVCVCSCVLLLCLTAGCDHCTKIPCQRQS